MIYIAFQRQKNEQICSSDGQMKNSSNSDSQTYFFIGKHAEKEVLQYLFQPGNT